ncbi:hypothetical protein COOONC_00513 [Cooperia oncophora]
MGDSRLNHLGSVLESKNATLRREAAVAFGKYCLSDDKVAEILLKYICSTSWDARVAAADALHCLLKNMEAFTGKVEEVPVSASLRDIEAAHVLKTYKPLLSDDGAALSASTSGIRVSAQQQRQLLDQHLDMSAAIGVTSAGFVNDLDILPRSSSNSPRHEAEELLTTDCSKLNAEVKVEAFEDTDRIELSSQIAFLKFFCRLLPLLADQRWQCRHGAAITIAKILSTSYSRRDACEKGEAVLLITPKILENVDRIPLPLVDSCALQLLHVLILDQFNDFVSELARVGKVLYFVFKYFFAVNFFWRLSDCFNSVVKSLDIQLMTYRIMFVSASLWMERLAVRLISIVETWNAARRKCCAFPFVMGRFSCREQIMIIVSMLDEQFQSRSQKIVTLLFTAFKRDSGVLNSEDILMILKLFYRVFLFSAPANDMLLLENVYITSKMLIANYGSILVKSRVLLDKIGPWAGCLLLDHRSAVIDVFTYCVDSRASTRDDPLERMASEEVRCLTDKEKDDVYITRKIIAAKFLATIIHLHYESGIEVDGQPVTEAIQLLFVPFLRSNLLYHNLGAAVILNEWAAVYRDSLNKGVQIDAPVTILQICDAFLRAPTKNYDELASAVNHLTMDCKEFVDYCVNRGVDRNQLCMGDSVSAEEISKMAFEKCLGILTAPNHIESLTTRYNVLVDLIEFTKLAVKTNTTRVAAFLASALFYFGFAPEKLTPMVRPLVECMQNEHNSTVSAEIFRGAVTLMIAYSWPRTPRPYVKVQFFF